MIPSLVMRLRQANKLPWTPSYLTVAPSGWWDDSTAVTNVSGAASTWADKLSSTFDLQQTTAVNRPTINATGLNGLRTLTFDGSNDFLVSNNVAARQLTQNASNAWAFAVVRKTSVDGAGAFRTVVQSNTGTSGTRLALTVGTSTGANRGASIVRRLDADSAAVLNGGTALGTGWRLAMVTQDWANRPGLVFLDGVQDASNATLTTAGTTSNTTSIEQLVMGASVAVGPVYSSYADIEVAAVLVGRNGLPTTTERQKLEGWAAWRYGLTANLDVSHPYKSVAPTA